MAALTPVAIGIQVFAILIIAGLWSSTEMRIARERQNAIDDVIRHNANLARTFEEHTIRTLGAADQLVYSLMKQFEAEGEAFDLPDFWSRTVINQDVILTPLSRIHRAWLFHLECLLSETRRRYPFR